MFKNIFKKIVTKILIFESKLVLSKYKPKIIAITGSVGKTSTKDAVYSVISEFAYVRKSEKSYNSQIGLPLTILGIQNGWNNPFVWINNIVRGFWLFIYPHKYPDWLVLEVGVGKPGDMAETAEWLSTDVVIITTIPETPVHIEFFNSRKHLVEEKARLIKTLKKDGILILNADDPTVLEMKSLTKNIVVTYGFSPDANFRASDENIFYGTDKIPSGLTFHVDQNGNSLPVVLEGVFGKNHVYAALIALATARVLGFNLLRSIDALRKHETPPGRMKVLRGINESIILDDSYNSSPFAAEAALDALGCLNTLGRKIAVLGDMLELGKHTEEAHKNLGKIAQKQADVLVVVGPRAQFIRDGAVQNRMAKKNIFEFSNSKDAGEFLRSFVIPGDLILIKGSQGMRLERAVLAILHDLANKDILLVRQDKEWVKRD